MKVLFISPLSLADWHGGDRIRTFNLIASLAQRVEVALVSLGPRPHENLMPFLNSWYELPNPDQNRGRRRSKILGPLELYVGIAARSRTIETAIRKFQPRVVWFESGFWGQYATIAHRFGCRTVMGTQNVQSDLMWQRLSICRGPAFAFTFWRWLLQRGHEAAYFSRFDRIVSVTKGDQDYHARMVGKTRSLLIPNYVNETMYENTLIPGPTPEKRVVMVGNFSAYQNRIGLKWFVNCVWPEVRRHRPEVILEIIGKGSQELGSPVAEATAVRCLGRVSSVVPLLKRAAISVVPIFYGSGSRFKILESMACGVPVVSTSKGAEGIELIGPDSIVLADSASEFSEAVILLLKDERKCRQLAENAGRLIRQMYGFETNTRRVHELLEGLSAEPPRQSLRNAG